MNLLYLSLIAFVFIASFALSLVKKIPVFEFPGAYEVLGTTKNRLSPIPVLKLSSYYLPKISAQSAYALDLDSRISLYEKEPDERLLPASLTKIVTALVVLDHFPLDRVLKVDGLAVDGQKMGLVKDEEITVENLLYGLLIYSANDAASVLAENFSGGRDAFVFAMNQKASNLFLVNSNFSNPIGFDSPAHFSTARDLVTVSEVAMKNLAFARIVGTDRKVVTSVDGQRVHNLVNINELVGKVPGVLGVKTGWTQNAQENLVTYLERDGRRIMISVLGSTDRFEETKRLIDWIFENYEWQTVTLSPNSKF